MTRFPETIFSNASKRKLAAVCTEDRAICSMRRGLLLAPFLAALPLELLGGAVRAGQVDPAETAITLSDAIKWSAWSGGPPHSYATDRLCVVVSGTWWINSGADFDPDNTVPVPAGGFVRRFAHTPHYDGVKRGAREPAVIALFGIAPVKFQLVDPSRPAWRQV